MTINRSGIAIHSCKKNGNRAGGNVIDFVAAMRGLSAYDAARHFDSLFPAAGTSAMTKPSNTSPLSVRHEAGGNIPLGFVLKDVNSEQVRIQERVFRLQLLSSLGLDIFPAKAACQTGLCFHSGARHRFGDWQVCWMGGWARSGCISWDAGEDSPSAVSARLRRSDTDGLANFSDASHN
jgi:hypothetical protein